MANLKAVTPEKFSDKAWLKPQNLLYARNEHMAALLGREMVTALTYTAIAFIKVGEDVVPVALLGLDPDRNLFIDGSGRWLGKSIPSTYEHYPFRLIKNQENNLVLCVDDSNGLVTDAGVGEPFFVENNELSEALRSKFDALVAYEKDFHNTKMRCNFLFNAGVLEPWPVQIVKDGETRTLEGYLRINETALNSLAIESFIELRDVGALVLAYCQLLSMQNIQVLGWMAKPNTNEQSAKAAVKPDPGDSFLTEDTGSISFENL